MAGPGFRGSPGLLGGTSKGTESAILVASGLAVRGGASGDGAARNSLSSMKVVYRDDS